MGRKRDAATCGAATGGIAAFGAMSLEMWVRGQDLNL